MSQADNLRGAGFMMLSMAGFALNDAMMKAVLTEHALFPSIFLRGLLATVLLYVLCRLRGTLTWRPSGADRKMIGLRTLAEMATTVSFLLALAHLPIATATAVLQSAPLAVTLAAAVLLREPVGWRRILALILGFAGVLLIIRPGSAGMSLWSLAAVAAVCGVVARDLLTRRFDAQIPSLTVALITSAAITLLGLIGTLFTAWPAFAGLDFLLLALSSPALIMAYVFSISAMRHGDIAFVSPFRYSILLWALVIGIVFFGELPDLWATIGAVLVVGAGLFTFWREQVVGRQARKGSR